MNGKRIITLLTIFSRILGRTENIQFEEEIMRITKVGVLALAAVTLIMWPARITLAEKLGTMVMTQNGWVYGSEETKDEYLTWSWKGIPYARPPIGELRWRAPQPPEDFGVLDASNFGPVCTQYSGYEVMGSEDCLYLNIWRPRTYEHNLPVYFYIHGGGNSIGSGSDSGNLGNTLATRGNMVVVTFNYRLGPLGWFLLPENLQNGDPLDNSGNYGTLDIIQALRWVRSNIAAFGGNPNNIVIAGESAGGFNVCTLLISPLAKGLFHKAISESGGFFVDTRSMEEGRLSAEAAIVTILEHDGYTDPNEYPEDMKAYLLGKTPAEIFGAYPGGGMLDLNVFTDRFRDGVVIHALGKEALENPDTYNQVPAILGTNKEELKIFMISSYGTISDELYQEMALDGSRQWQQIGVDYLAAAMSANKGQPDVFAYRFDYGAYNQGGYNAWPIISGLDFAVMIGACHTLELPFLYGDWSWYGSGQLIFRQDNQEGWQGLSESMVKYWGSFARTGHPFDPTGVLWRPWSNKEGGPKRILLDANANQTLIQMSDQ
jgi:para-nitrobenzyl esterase